MSGRMCRVAVVLSEQERTVIASAAGDLGLSASAFMRYLALQVALGGNSKKTVGEMAQNLFERRNVCK